jgi:hypothetical protein
MSRAKRSDSDLIAAARKLAPLIPTLKKYKKRKTLTRYERSKITRYERAMKGAYNLEPVSKKQAKHLRDVLYTGAVEITRGPRKGQYREVRGIHALQLANTGEHVKINVTENKDMFVTTNGRTWVYWQLEQLGEKEYEQYLDEGYSEEEALELIADENKSTMRSAAAQSFAPTIREAFPVEKIIRLAQKAFKKPHVHMIGLWSTKGRVGEGFRNFDEFKQWIYQDYSTYANVEKWVNGIAILIAERGERIDQTVWSARTVKQIAEDRKKRRQKLRAEQRKQRGK